MWLFLLVPTTDGPNSSSNTRDVKSGATRSQVKQNTACRSLIAFPLLPASCNFIFQTTCCPPRIQSTGFGGRAGAKNPVQSGPNFGIFSDEITYAEARECRSAARRDDDDLALDCQGVKDGRSRFPGEPAARCVKKVKICSYAGPLYEPHTLSVRPFSISSIRPSRKG